MLPLPRVDNFLFSGIPFLVEDFTAMLFLISYHLKVE